MPAVLVTGATVTQNSPFSPSGGRIANSGPGWLVIYWDRFFSGHGHPSQYQPGPVWSNFVDRDQCATTKPDRHFIYKTCRNPLTHEAFIWNPRNCHLALRSMLSSGGSKPNLFWIMKIWSMSLLPGNNAFPSPNSRTIHPTDVYSSAIRHTDAHTACCK